MSSTATGPRTEIGKAISNQNARTHGVCSDVLILPNESKEEFDSLTESYFNFYSPTSQLEAGFVQYVAEAAWRLRRATRHYDNIEYALYDRQPDPGLWSPDDHKKLARFKRMLDSLRKERAAEQRFRHNQADRARRISLADFKLTENLKHRQNRLSLATERHQALLKRREKADKGGSGLQ